MSAHDELCGYCEVRGRRGQHGHLAYADCDRGELGDWLAEVGADLRWAEESECEDQAWVAHLRLRQAELVAQVGPELMRCVASWHPPRHGNVLPVRETPTRGAPTMDTYTCDCKVCKGITFMTPVGYIGGRDVKAQIHNYAQMLRHPIFGKKMNERGLRLV